MPTRRPKRPDRGLRQTQQDDAGEDDVDDAAQQHPDRAAGELAAMIDGIHDRGDALDDEERDEHQRERQRADDRGREQRQPGEDADRAPISATTNIPVHVAPRSS